MKEDNHDRNIWRDKLGKLPVPGASPMWEDMKRRLDKEMPARKKDNRWLAGLLILLLFIGICTYETKWRSDGLKQTAGNNENGANHPSKSQAVTTRPRRAQAGKRAEVPAATPSYNRKEHANADPTTADTPVNDFKKENTVARTRVSKDRTSAGKKAEMIAVRKRSTIKPPDHPAGVHLQRDKIEKAASEKKPILDDLLREQKQPVGNVPDTQIAASVKQDSALKKIDSILPAKKDPQKTDTVKSNKERIWDREKKTRFAFAVGLNQFFALGNQEKANFNSNGQSGTWSDYLPVPQVRIYHGKRWYAQVEAQFNTPQYTEQLLADQFVSDTNQFGQRAQRTVYIKKLFYFNVPFSVHYRLTPHINVGGGLQFSRLTSTIGLVEQSTLSMNRPDSIVSSKIMVMSPDSMAQQLRTNEFRFLVDASYQWKKFHAGIRYNQAFTPFINYQVSNTEVTQARNNSLQLYLRYTFFER